MLVRTHAQCWVADGLFPKQEPTVPFLVFLRQVLVARRPNIQQLWTILLRTGDFLHDADLVHQVVMQTPLAKLMFAISHSRHLVHLEPGFAELTETPRKGATHDDVLDVETLHLLLRGRTTQEARFNRFGQLDRVAVVHRRLVGEADGREAWSLDLGVLAGTVLDGPLHGHGRQTRFITKSNHQIRRNQDRVKV